MPQDVREIALTLADRLSDPGRARSHFSKSNEQLDTLGGIVSRPEGSLPAGFGSLALFFGELDQLDPGAGFDLLAHNYLSCMAEAVSNSVGGVGLFSDNSIAGLRLVAATLATGNDRYRTLIARADSALSNQVDTLLQTYQGQPAPTVYFDLISGLVGLVASLLTGPTTYGSERSVVLIATELAARVRAHGVDGYHVPAHFLSDEEREDYPDGYVNTGVAHGVAGVLAALSLAMTRGYEVQGAAASVLDLAEWLISNRQDDRWGLNWPYYVGSSTRTSVSHSGWCYGPAGIARSLELASQAVGEQRFRQVARETLLGIARRPEAERLLPGPGLCHGTGGLLTILASSPSAVTDLALAALRESITRDLVRRFSPSAPVGFRDHSMGGWIDDPGFLSGAVGTAMALLFTSSPSPGPWRRCLLIA